MVNMNDAFPSKFLSSADLNGQEPTYTISGCKMEELGDHDMKPVVYFNEVPKGLTINKTNATTLSNLYGPESDAWIGKQVTLFTIWTEFQGKQTQGLRVRAPGAVQGYGGNPNLPDTGQAPIDHPNAPGNK